jgi:hypothetical protein
MTYRGPYINPDVSAEYRRADDTAFEENRRTGNFLARAPTHDEIAARLGVPVYMSAEETAVVNAYATAAEQLSAAQRALRQALIGSCPVKVGDIVKSTDGRLGRVDRIYVNLDVKDPYAAAGGKLLRKDGSVGERRFPMYGDHSWRLARVHTP